MKNKIIELYKNNLDDFIEFIVMFYEAETLERVYMSYKHPMAENNTEEVEYLFQMNGMVYNLETIIEDITATYVKSQLLKEYGLLD